jgi:hypothetical protein
LADAASELGITYPPIQRHRTQRGQKSTFSAFPLKKLWNLTPHN